MKREAKKSKGQLEAEISEAIIKFEKESMGRGPNETKTYILDDIVLVRLKGVLTHTEQQLAGTSDAGLELIKRTRTMLIEKGRPALEAAIESITGEKIRSICTDISAVTQERFILFTLQ